MPWHLSCTVRVSCPKKDRIHRGQPSLLLIFPLLSYKQKILSMELISALLAWRLFWIYLEKWNIFCLSAKKILEKVQKQHLERGMSQWWMQAAGTIHLTSWVTLSPASSYWISFNVCKEVYTRAIFIAVESALPHGLLLFNFKPCNVKKMWSWAM